MDENAVASSLRDRIATRSATVGVCGMGYVGLPLAVAIAQAGHSAIGFDVDDDKVVRLNNGSSYIDAVRNEQLTKLVSNGQFRATSDFGEIGTCDVIVICVPTPLTKNREPDLSYVKRTARAIAVKLRPGQLVVLESTTYPGTTNEVVKPILEATGLSSGIDFFLGFSPEREDPGNREFSTEIIPKIVAGDGEQARDLVLRFYGSFVKQVVPVSSNDVAEAVKLTENIFRAVNIALANELKVIFSAMGIDVWEVIDAAKTKPFGFMPFYPGPGLGGHCIPIDPFYLAWKSREYDLSTRFIELAGEINVAMPRYVVQRLAEALDGRFGTSLGSARILILGLAYKKNVSDIRESPSLKLIELLEKRKARVDFHDPLVPVIPQTRRGSGLQGRQSIALNARSIASYDAVLIATDHDCVGYDLIVRNAKLVVDTRNVIARLGLSGDVVVKA